MTHLSSKSSDSLESVRPGATWLTSVDKNLVVFLALFLFGLYMLTFDGTLHSTDGLSMIAVTENMIKHGRFDTRQLENWESARVGLDSAPHTVFPLGPTLFMLPFYLSALILPYLGLTQTTMIAMPLFSALTAIYTYLSARRLNYTAKTGLVVTLLAGLATTTWPRMRDLVADPLTLFCLTAAFYYALAYRQEKRLLQAGLLGLVLGLTILNKTVNGVILPFFFGYLFFADFNRLSWRKIKWQPLLVAGCPVVIAMLLVLGYNALRFGHPFDSGYRDSYSVLLRTPIWIGFVGVIINPYKSIFLYIPLFILLPGAIKPMWRQHRPEFILILTLLLSYMVTYGTFYDWGGGRNWGPRYLAPLNALLTLLLLPVMAQAFEFRRWLARLAVILLGGLSLGMQLLGISARDNAFLDAADYWTPPPNLSFWGELRWDNPDQWPIWGHLLRFNLSQIPVIWRWQWAGLHHFDLLALLVLLLIVAMGLSGLVIVYRYQHQPKWAWPITAWLVAAACVLFVLVRSYDDPRSIKDEAEAAELWPAYQALLAQLPALVSSADAVIFTDRRFEFYLLDTDKSFAQRYVVAKPTQPEILESVPRLLQRQAGRGRVWLVTDELDNRQLAYATELWLRQYGQVVEVHVYEERVRLTAFELPAPSTPWPPIPPEPQLAGVVKPDDYRFNGIAALLGWHWPSLKPGHSTTLQVGQAYPFELYWIYHGKAASDTFFVRLLDSTDQPVAENVLPPHSDSKLITGQMVIETTTLALPADLPPGLYHLQLGFYTAAVDAGELIFDLPAELTEIRVINHS